MCVKRERVCVPSVCMCVSLCERHVLGDDVAIIVDEDLCLSAHELPPVPQREQLPAEGAARDHPVIRLDQIRLEIRLHTHTHTHTHTHNCHAWAGAPRVCAWR